MKIVYCIDSLAASGGTERVITTKLNWLVDHSEISVWVVTLKEEVPPFFALSDRVNRLMLDVADKRNYRSKLETLLRTLSPDITIAVAGMSIDILPLLKDGSKKVLEFHYTKNFLVNFVNGMRSLRFRKLHLMKMYWLQWRLACVAQKYDCMVGLTRRDVGLWGNPSNMTYIYNPLSFRSETKSTCVNKRIIAVGSWTPAKGMDQLLEAFGLLAEKYPDWHVDLYGAGQDESLLKEIIRRNNMENQVSLNPPSSNIGDKLVEASIYAFPSRSDGFGLVITEAMECGIPTVAMDCECGPREIVTKDTGIVVPDKDISAFSAALEKLMTDEALRKRMGHAAVERVSRFYPDRIMPIWIELFSRLKNNLKVY